MKNTAMTTSEKITTAMQSTLSQPSVDLSPAHHSLVKKKKILLVASGGGHWVQLMRLRHTFSGHNVSCMTTDSGYAQCVEGRHYVVQDANMWTKKDLVKMFLQVAFVLLKARPDVVVTTGAAPGFAAIVFGRLLGARTIWIDSIANAETLSQSGAKAGRWAHIWLTQWEHLAKPEGPFYWGAVL